MPILKSIGGKIYTLVKTTPSKREADETKKNYKGGGYSVRVEKDGRVYHVFVRR